MSGNPYLNKPQDKYASATISKKATTIVSNTKVPGSNSSSTAPTAPVQNKQERVRYFGFFLFRMEAMTLYFYVSFHLNRTFKCLGSDA